MKRHICQGPKCHTYDTQSRVRGPKGSKVLRTRNARFDLNVSRDWIDNWEYFFCDERCMNNWLDVHMTQLISFVGLKTKPSETPVDVIKEQMDGWRGKFVRTTIKLLSEQTNDDNVTT
jgi:hypothetical protein